jgi:integrase
MKIIDLADEVYKRHWRGCKSGMGLLQNAEDVCDRMGNGVQVNKVDERMIDDLVLDLEGDRKANGTINRRLAALSKMLRHAYRRGYIERLPAIERKREPQGRMRWLNEEEEMRMLGKFHAMGKPFVADFCKVLIDTGMRTGELFKLRARDVDLNERMIHLWETKNGKSRSIPLTTRAYEVLARYKARVHIGDLFLFDFTQDVLNHAWKKMKTELGMLNDKEFIPHCLRHTCASRLVQRGVDIRVVQEWLGHSSIQTTMRYAKIAPKNLADARDVLERH